MVLKSFYRVFATTSTFVEPPGYSRLGVEMWGGGADGAKELRGRHPKAGAAGLAQNSSMLRLLAGLRTPSAGDEVVLERGLDGIKQGTRQRRCFAVWGKHTFLVLQEADVAQLVHLVVADE